MFSNEKIGKKFEFHIDEVKFIFYFDQICNENYKLYYTKLKSDVKFRIFKNQCDFKHF